MSEANNGKRERLELGKSEPILLSFRVLEPSLQVSRHTGSRFVEEEMAKRLHEATLERVTNGTIKCKIGIITQP